MSRDFSDKFRGRQLKKFENPCIMLYYDSESVKEFREHPQKAMYESSIPVGVILMHDSEAGGQ